MRQIVCIGGGVIGSGWAARYAGAGIAVTVYDPSPASAQTVAASLAASRRAWGRLALTLPEAGRVDVIHQTAELTAALATADFVQESLPEQEALKQKVLAQIEPHLKKDTLIASSTSGLLPSRLQSVLTHPQRFCVAHPFTPVYLLPLVEICGGRQTSEQTKQQAAAFYQSIGMLPLVLKKEIDGFIADRLMEALWREALWLVNDDIATAAEIDDAIRLGCGLRWAFMGPFLTYRLGGGEGGMRHFMRQFAPALKLPWTKLMDTPEMTEALLDKIVSQSDAQAGSAGIDDLTRWRDDCLTGVMRSLAGAGSGIGRALAAGAAPPSAAARPLPSDAPAEKENIAAPLRLHQMQVPAEWLDYNGHMTEWRYLQLFSDASDALLRLIGIDNDYVAGGRSYYTVETHLRHLAEAHAGELLTVHGQVLAADEKRLHIFYTLHRGDTPVATAEQMLLHVHNGRAAAAEEQVINRLQAIAAAHAVLPRPPAAGRHTGKTAG